MKTETTMHVFQLKHFYLQKLDFTEHKLQEYPADHQYVFMEDFYFYFDQKLENCHNYDIHTELN
jgi:hypothetical protein